jgi:hypothetical protein
MIQLGCCNSPLRLDYTIRLLLHIIHAAAPLLFSYILCRFIIFPCEEEEEDLNQDLSSRNSASFFSNKKRKGKERKKDCGDESTRHIIDMRQLFDCARLAFQTEMTSFLLGSAHDLLLCLRVTLGRQSTSHFSKKEIKEKK